MNVLITIVSGLFVATITSVLTVRLALWRFHSEKWWERKAELYSKLMEALYDMYSYNSQWLDDYHEWASDIDEAAKQKREAHAEELWRRHQLAKEEVEKITVIGAFVVSDSIADDLQQFRKENAYAINNFNATGGYEAAEACLKAAKDCLTRVREHAKEDLGIKRKLPQILEHGRPVVASVAQTVFDRF